MCRLFFTIAALRGLFKGGGGGGIAGAKRSSQGTRRNTKKTVAQVSRSFSLENIETSSPIPSSSVTFAEDNSLLRGDTSEKGCKTNDLGSTNQNATLFMTSTEASSVATLTSTVPPNSLLESSTPYSTHGEM